MNEHAAPIDLARVQPVTLLVCALGGEGGGVLAEWLVDAAARDGFLAQSTSIPGVAQRTGATTYYVEVFPVPEAQLGGRVPVFGLSPVAGALDALVASELLEATRQTALGLVSKDRTTVIAARDRTLTTAEKMVPSDGRVAADQLAAVLRTHGRAVHLLDMQSLAQAAGTVLSAVMLGAIAGSGLLPMRRDAYEGAVAASGIGVDASLRGFAGGFDAVAARAGGAAQSGAIATPDKQNNARAPAPPIAPTNPSTGAAGVAQTGTLDPARWPAPVAEFALLGVQRLRDYQGAAYADLYCRRVDRIVAAEHAADPGGEHAFQASRETARWLALWMAFDDIVHVARLKSRTARYERVRREVKAVPGEIVRVFDDHFKPGIPECAALLPSPLARRLAAWDRGRQARGKAPLAFPMKIASHGVLGLLMLRVLGALRPLRPLGSRFKDEQALMEQWLRRVEDGLAQDWVLGNEIALCGKLIKGYGATNERGKQILSHVLDHLAAAGAGPAERARNIALARVAALADDAGKALDRQLAELGAPPRPLKPQPVVWARPLARDGAQSRPRRAGSA